MDRKALINIIAGGSSVSQFNMDEVLDTGFTIGVNQSSVDFDVDMAISMDRLFMEGRYKILERKGVPTYFRRCAWKLGYHWDQLELFDGDIKTEFMTDRYGILVGNNSGACAINKAYQLRPKKLFLFGFDMCAPKGKHHHHKEYEWTPDNVSASKYNYWNKRFKTIYRQLRDNDIEVFNVSPNSAIKEIPKLDWEGYRNELKR